VLTSFAVPSIGPADARASSVVLHCRVSVLTALNGRNDAQGLQQQQIGLTGRQPVER
jgi:hypothetical protein